MKRLIFLAMAVLFVFTITHIPAVQAQPLKKITLRHSDHVPAMYSGNVYLKKQYFPRIQEKLARIGYELDITFYHSGSLYKYSDQVMAVEQGSIDLTYAVIPYEAARAPLHEVLDFGFMGWDHTTMNKVWSGLKANVPEFGAEFSKDTVELFHAIVPKKILNNNVEGARVPADFKGLKIHSAGFLSDLIQYIGGIPIRQNPGEWYSSLDRGLFQGIFLGFDMTATFRLNEVLVYHVFGGDLNFGYPAANYLMNRKKFQSLPPGVQKVLSDNVDWASNGVTQDSQSRLPRYFERALKAGGTFIYLTKAETALWDKAAKAVHKNWVDKLEKKGHPAKKVYEEALRLVKEYKK